MSLHATEVADHLGNNLIRYRVRPSWRSVLFGNSVITVRTKKKRRGWRLGQALLSLVLLVSICALYLLFVHDRRQVFTTRASSTARRHRLREPNQPQDPPPILEPLPILPIRGDPFDAEDFEIVPRENVTIVLPVDTGSYAHLPSLLAPFFIAANRPGELIVAAPPSLLDDVLVVVKATLLTLRDANVPLRVLAWQDDLSARVGWLHVAAKSTKDYVVILDEKGSHDISPEILASLLSPKALPYPVGPRGASFSPTNISCTEHTYDTYAPVAFLVPPLVVPTSLLQELEGAIRMNDFRVWFSLGERTARLTGQAFGGLAHTPFSTLASPTSHAPEWCSRAKEQVLEPGTNNNLNPRQIVFDRYRAFQMKQEGHKPDLPIGIILANVEELTAFAFTICRMASRGRAIRIYLYDEPSYPHGARAASLGGCHLHYDVREKETATIDQLQSWLSRNCISPSVVLHTIRHADETLLLGLVRIYTTSSASTIIWLPFQDLPVSGWIAELSTEELQSWNIPHIELSVITNNRPASLRRLLSSLQKASYYGDQPILSINLEETADAETLREAQNIKWPGAGAQLRHRVVRGGLLPAVVEAWYPFTNDTYGVLLEDDVEVSPMFYAWLKFTILRYRYGPDRAESSRLFGVSLYQAKHIELKPEGRHPFNAQILFTNSSMRYPHSPYLSQVPCSWGAVFFPEHWREFHQYLSLRLSPRGQDLGIDIVPNIRSNKWANSWKRYFIEMTYLRGYVMLYPNYDHFVSLSTNHLEPGEHARYVPERILTKKKAQFQVPLMGHTESDYGVHLLDLPQGTLPSWHDLPVLDLWGNIASLDLLTWRGAYRHEEVTECSRLLSLDEPSTYNADELLCLHDDDHDDEEEEEAEIEEEDMLGLDAE
ncbi:hypothetical protein DACRYDRAFT_105713 [Dacryopinax primogenitus]|uniref:Glycosyltransferase 2 n=1 Tax=Dacryopinax primogenitus (strain DJM 731) TaxID=1858805 RepID=M5G4D1_DACPD|nr:uncharacterized protein DACRYDRAFT_105713 [Dacryopinax primogenitus]EJU03554.1 hypothetical protein DACRYDRAFT_105713 [Dacryopinax primogenitus]